MKIVFEVETSDTEFERRKRIRCSAKIVSFGVSVVSNFDFVTRNSHKWHQRMNTIGPRALIIRPTLDPFIRNLHKPAIVRLLVSFLRLTFRIWVVLVKAPLNDATFSC